MLFCPMLLLSVKIKCEQPLKTNDVGNLQWKATDFMTWFVGATRKAHWEASDTQTARVSTLSLKKQLTYPAVCWCRILNGKIKFFDYLNNIGYDNEKYFEQVRVVACLFMAVGIFSCQKM